jgi:mRNA interferase RelE/StbE
MQVFYEKSFLKDIKKINDKNIANKLKKILNKFEEEANLTTFLNVKKLKGFDNFYRIKIGNYRLGFKYENESIEVIRFLHRKDIYKLFP